MRSESMSLRGHGLRGSHNEMDASRGRHRCASLAVESNHERAATALPKIVGAAKVRISCCATTADLPMGPLGCSLKAVIIGLSFLTNLAAVYFDPVHAILEIRVAARATRAWIARIAWTIHSGRNRQGLMRG